MMTYFVDEIGKQQLWAKNCSSYEGCGAPLCPMDERTLKNCQWFPDEPVCTRRGSMVPDWVKTQRKVAKRAKHPEFYFTVNDFLVMKRVIRPTGHDPNVYDSISSKNKANNKANEKNKEPGIINPSTQQGRLF
jgi:hypothetical protein